MKQHPLVKSAGRAVFAMTLKWNNIVLLLCVAGLFIAAHSKRSFAMENPSTSSVHHYEYVFPDGFICVYDMDHGFDLVKAIPVPTNDGVRGSVASAATGKLYISHGNSGNGGINRIWEPLAYDLTRDSTVIVTLAVLLERYITRGFSSISLTGKLLAYDLATDTISWTHTYLSGIDSMSVSPDGRTIYMPTGSGTAGGAWKVIDASTGNVIGSIDTGSSQTHNTLMSLNGSHAYLETEASNYLYKASTSRNTVVGTIGPFNNAARPFTINGSETYAFVSTTGFLGFSVGDIRTGKVLYTVPIRGFSTTPNSDTTDPAHGVSLSPEENELYVVDSINSMVHVFDVSGLPAMTPKQVADLHLQNPLKGNESNCAYSCLRDGWIHHSRDGKFVFVGDSGDVIDTKLRKTVAILPAMANTRKEIEIDFQNGAVVWAMNNRQSIGALVTHH